MTGFESVEDVQQKLESVDYIPSREIATVVYLAAATQKPILVEGPAGAGKTELARAIARCLNLKKIRLQCYEGLGVKFKDNMEWFAFFSIFEHYGKGHLNSQNRLSPHQHT